MTLRAVAPGPLATVQDQGRTGFRGFGVPTSGPFDRPSAAIANALAGNRPGTAVVELSCFGGIYEIANSVQALWLALGGASMAARVDIPNAEQQVLTIPCAFPLRFGERLVLGPCVSGYRTYLAVSGGWLTPETLGSRCDESPLTAGKLLPCRSSPRVPNLFTELGRIDELECPIRFIAGPDETEIDTKTLEAAKFVIDLNSDRMGVRLRGPSIATTLAADRLSSPVTPGTIQIAGGQPIILGPACGTMGGYPSAGHILSVDLDRVGQLRPGSVVQFERIGYQEAWRIDREARAQLAKTVLRLTTAVGL
jgi:5-oxoprolinase (ATP-hydrolysing) subunit C